MITMKTLASRRNTCRLCESPNLTLVLPISPSAIADDYVNSEHFHEKQPVFPLDVFLCNNCKHTQLLVKNYTYVTKVSLGLVDHFKKLSQHLIARLQLPPRSLIVEMGSNDGTLLSFFKESGYQVLGIDPATEIAKKATASGVETISNFFSLQVATQIRQERGPASLFIANNVFAHSDNLGDITNGIQHLLAPEGVFAFEVSYMVDIVEKMIWDTIFHEHLSFHAIRPFVHFFQLHGMELFDVERIPTKGGSIRGYAQLKGGPRQVTARVGELLALEEKMKFGEAETFIAYANKIEKEKHALLDLLKKLRAEGKTIAGYGASATVTTLLHHYDLGDKLDFIVDDNPIKQGTFSPGHHIPILKPTAIQEKKPDYIVILAWMYAQPIIEKNQDYLASGGHFIIPNPVLKVV